MSTSYAIPGGVPYRPGDPYVIDALELATDRVISPKYWSLGSP